MTCAVDASSFTCDAYHFGSIQDARSIIVPVCNLESQVSNMRGTIREVVIPIIQNSYELKVENDVRSNLKSSFDRKQNTIPKVIGNDVK